MSNKDLSALNEILFDQLDRLNDKDLSAFDMKSEIDRSKAITGVATQVIDNARVTIDALALVAKLDYNATELPKLLGVENKPSGES